MQKKSFDKLDSTMTSPNTKAEIVKLGDNTVVRATYQPGWKWSNDIKPAAGTDTCQVHHLIALLSGQLKIVMDDGAEMEVGAGEVVDVPPGHDAWVVGDEPTVAIDIGQVAYA